MRRVLICKGVLFFMVFGNLSYAQTASGNNYTCHNASFKFRGQADFKKLPLDKWHVSILSEDQEANVAVTQSKKNSSLQYPNPGQGNSQERIKSQSSPTGSIAIQASQSFTGCTLANQQPADNGTSVSNGKFIVHAVNGDVIIYDTLGNTLVGAASYQSVFDTTIMNTSDPRVVYDAYSDRFILLISAKPNLVMISFSQTNDPTGKWNNYFIKTESVGTSLEILDYPYLMVNEHELMISGVEYSSNYKGAEFIQIRKKDGYEGAGTLLTKIWQNIKNSDGDAADYTAGVSYAQQGDPYGNDIYLISTTTTLVGVNYSKVYYYEITDSINGSPVLNSYGISTNSYTHETGVSQKGSGYGVLADDSRIMGAILLHGAIHFTYHALNPATGLNQVVYNRLNIAKNTMSTSFFGNDTVSFCYPSVASFATSPDDSSVVICYLESSAAMYPSIAAVACDNNMDWGIPIPVRMGSGPIGDSPNGGYVRWGDYTSCVRAHNAVKPTVWISGEYGLSGSPVSSNWIAQITGAVTTSVQNNTLPGFSSVVYPNPVATESFLTVEFGLEKSEAINVSVFDANGRLVKELLNGWTSEGKTRLSFNKNALVSGLYYLRISDGNSVLKTEKVVVE